MNASRFSHIGDIDIDVADRATIAKLFPEAVPASQYAEKGNPASGLVRHNSGLYFTDVPWDPVSGIAAVDFREAEARGYFKVDLLTLSLYERVRDEAHLIKLMESEPDWNLLLDRSIVANLVQLGNHARALEIVRPHSVAELAAVLALIRPSHSHLIDELQAGRIERDALLHDLVWRPAADGYAFKKSHATAYAMTVVVDLNLVREAA